jgi:lipopolysaccharide heptosyltransferase II
MAMAARSLEGQTAGADGRAVRGEAVKAKASGAGMRLAIVKTSSIGDVIHALPIAEIIKRHYPGAFVGWVVRRRCASLLEGNPFIDRTYVLPDRPTPRDLLDLTGRMRADHNEIAFDMQGLLLSGLVARLTGARRRVGLDLNREGNHLFLTEPIVPARADRDRHAIDILRGFLPTIGIDAGVAWPKLGYLAEAETLPEEMTRLDRGAGAIALNVGASSIYKQWPEERWAELAHGLCISGYAPIVLGGPQDIVRASVVARVGDSGTRLINMAGRTSLRGLASVLASCDLLVSADTGPLHVAAALGTPVLALFGPTSPERTGPYGDHNRVIWKRLACSPCYRKPTCAGKVDCMRAITVDEVHAAAISMVKETTAC